MIRKATPIKERLLAKREINSNGCWVWNGSVNAAGYGVAPITGLPRAHRQKLVHRIAAYLWNGFPLDSRLKVLHRCDNPPCFNPDHLFVGTQVDNVRDCVSKGRNRGHRGPRKLNPDDYNRIREMKHTTGLANKHIGDAFGISHTYVGRILAGKSWG